FCGQNASKYQQQFGGPLMAGLADPVPANRQAACYGIGVAAQNGGPAFAEFVAAALKPLFDACKLTNARLDDHVFATENACASIAKILKFNSSMVPNAQQIVDLWIGTLPIINDDEAAPYAYNFLADLIDQYVY